LSRRRTCTQIILVWPFLLVLSCSCPFVDLLLPLLPFLGVELVLWSNARPWCVIFFTLSDLHSTQLVLDITFLVLSCSCPCSPTSPRSTCTLLQRHPRGYDRGHVVGGRVVMLLRLNHLGLAIAFRVLSGQGTRQAFDPYPQRAMPRRDALSGRRCSRQQQLAASDGCRERHISPLEDRATMDETALIMFRSVCWAGR
jgi:hypothetical protein